MHADHKCSNWVGFNVCQEHNTIALCVILYPQNNHNTFELLITDKCKIIIQNMSSAYSYNIASHVDDRTVLLVNIKHVAEDEHGSSVNYMYTFQIIVHDTTAAVRVSMLPPLSAKGHVASPRVKKHPESVTKSAILRRSDTQKNLCLQEQL